MTKKFEHLSSAYMTAYNERMLLEKLKMCALDKHGNFKVCSGCAHSAGMEPFPGIPSGERPCFFCERNTHRDEWQRDYEKTHGCKLVVWYDGSQPVNVPMDCYHSVDMIEQIHRWGSKDDGE